MSKNKSASYKLLAVLLLCVGTILLFNDFDQYRVIGPELLTNNRFQEQLNHWQYSKPGVSISPPGSGVAFLQSENPLGIINLSQTIANVDYFRLLRLSCDLKSLDIPPHDEGWHVARVVLFSNDHDGKPVYTRAHHLASLTGGHDWEHHEGAFPVYPDSNSVSLFIQLAQTTGSLWIRNMSLRPIAEKRSFRAYRNTAMALWILTCLWIVVPMIKSSIGNTQRATVLMLALVILVGVLMPEAMKEYIGRTLFPTLAGITDGAVSNGTFQFLPVLRKPDIYKLGHFTLFALLAATALYRRPYSVSRGGIFGCLILFAFSTEVLQLFVPGRTPLLSDVMVDSAGIILVLVLLRIAFSDIK